MERRDFIRLSLAGGVAAAVPQQLLAADSAAGMAGGVYYTAENPGRWAKKVGGHLPSLEKSVAADGSVTVKVATDHAMSGYKHYIIKHQLLNNDYRFLGETMFHRDEDEPVSEYKLPAGYKGKVYALSMCNKHDLWLNLESSVGRGEVCVCGGAGQGTTTRNSDSIPRSCNAAMCRRKRAIHPVA